MTSTWGARKGLSDTMPSAVRFLLRLGDAAAGTTREAGLGRANDDNKEEEEGDGEEPSKEREDGLAHRALLQRWGVAAAAGERKPSILPDRRPAAADAAAVGRTTAETAVAAPVVADKARQRPRKDIAPISTAVGLVGCLLAMWEGGRCQRAQSNSRTRPLSKPYHISGDMEAP